MIFFYKNISIYSKSTIQFIIRFTTRFTTMESCNICVENFNKNKHSKVICPYCQFTSCRSCCEHYILEQRVAKCMNNECDKQWTRKFLMEAFPKSFVNDKWKKVKEQVCFEREKALLPATQSIVEDILEQEKLKKEIERLDTLINSLMSNRHKLGTRLKLLSLGSVQKTQESRHFVRACPQEDCRGFLSTQWKCGICEKTTCSKCHIIKGSEEHTCNPDDVETANLLNKDTKPCPKCATGIFKIEGCDQMWCTQCHTAFSWKTGRIETKIHNPHFYEWQRRTNGGVAPRVAGDLVCGRDIDMTTARNIWYKILPYISNGTSKLPTTVHLLNRKIGRTCETILHLSAVQLGRYRVDNVENNENLRVQYLMNRLSEDDFKTKIQRVNKSHEKKQEVGQVLHMFIQTITDIMYRVDDYITSLAYEEVVCSDNVMVHVWKMLSEADAIRDYSNECFKEIANTFSSKPLQLRFYDHEPVHYNGPRHVLF